MSELAKALAAAQGEIKNAVLNKTNPHFKSKYADLSAVRDAVTPALSKHGLAITQTTKFVDGHLFLYTTLHHANGESVQSEYPLPLMVDRPQQMGSAITYARRYSLAAMVGIASDEDDDANAATEAQRQAPARKRDAPASAEPVSRPQAGGKGGTDQGSGMAVPKPTLTPDSPPEAGDRVEPHEIQAASVGEYKAKLLHHFHTAQTIDELELWWRKNIARVTKIDMKGRDEGKSSLMDAAQEIRDAYDMRAAQLQIEAPKEAAQ